MSQQTSSRLYIIYDVNRSAGQYLVDEKHVSTYRTHNITFDAVGLARLPFYKQIQMTQYYRKQSIPLPFVF
jgi:hypothetical protein